MGTIAHSMFEIGLTNFYTEITQYYKICKELYLENIEGFYILDIEYNQFQSEISETIE